MSALLRYCTCLVLALLGTLASGPAAAQPAAQEQWEATFRILLQGRNVGTENISVVRDPSGLTLRSSGGLAGGGYALRSSEIVYDATGTARSLKIEARLKNQALLVDMTVADGRVVYARK